MAKPKLGTGERFRQLKNKIAARGDARDAAAVAAAIGRKKYGKARFQKMAAAGRRRHGGEGGSPTPGITRIDPGF